MPTWTLGLDVLDPCPEIRCHSAPWWRRQCISTVAYWVRTDGQALSSLSSALPILAGSFAAWVDVNKVEWQRLHTFDLAHPLPRPTKAAGQVWIDPVTREERLVLGILKNKKHILVAGGGTSTISDDWVLARGLYAPWAPVSTTPVVRPRARKPTSKKRRDARELRG